MAPFVLGYSFNFNLYFSLDPSLSEFCYSLPLERSLARDLDTLFPLNNNLTDLPMKMFQVRCINNGANVNKFYASMFPVTEID